MVILALSSFYQGVQASLLCVSKKQNGEGDAGQAWTC